jgi:plasmid stability protein
MSKLSVTLDLPDTVYQEIKKRANQKNRSIEAELAEVVSQVVPNEEDQLAPEMAELVSQIQELEEVYLWRLAKSKFPQKDSRRIEFLHRKLSEELIETEKEELAILMLKLERFFLSRATAIGELGKRGQDVSKLLQKK